jgi:pyrroloquinoline-quinone synthase
MRRDTVTFWDRLDAVRADWDVLAHPFYERWSRGELLREELARYSGQYRHAVVALADASAAAAPDADGELRRHLDEHAAEEAEHVELWDRFVEATGGDVDATATPETEICAATWAGAERSVEETLVALYAIESAQPRIAEVKRLGLVEEYGFEEGPATTYFDVHAERDHEHAAAHRAHLEAALDDADQDDLIEAARQVLAANWALLDGVEREQHEGE